MIFEVPLNPFYDSMFSEQALLSSQGAKSELSKQSMNRHSRTERKHEMYVKLFIKYSAFAVQFSF